MSAKDHRFYTAGANPQESVCGNKPEWAGQPCMTRHAGAVSGHDPDRMPGSLPVRHVTGYHRYGDPTTVTEAAGGSTRTTVTGYDAAGRVVSGSVTSDLGVALESVTTGYDPVNGRATTTQSGSATIAREFDALGRSVKYTDAGGAVTTTEYDRVGKLVKIADPHSSTTYAYDRASEPRGFLTSVSDSVAGSFGARYAPDGQLVEVSYPGGITRRDRLDSGLDPVERVYTRDSDGAVVYSEAVTENSAGQWVNHAYTGGDKTYGYDRLGRLTRTRHDSSVSGGCVTRTYGYDNQTNRTSKSVFGPAADGACQEATASSVDTHSYDTADRLVDSGYHYDAFGRVTTLPDGLTNTYFVNDLVQKQELDDVRQVWTLDPSRRFRTFTTETLVDGAWTPSTSKVNHYSDDSDEPRWVVTDTVTGDISRNVSGPDGDLAATTSASGNVKLHLTNLHGDVVVTTDPALVDVEAFDYDEFGNAQAGQADQAYGWLGGKQRSGEALGDVILMGVRLYSPSLGRFLQVDPVDGGSCNDYDYACADPVNQFDLDGQRCWGPKWACRKAAAVGRGIARGASAVGRWAYRHRGAIATAVATGACLTPAVGWAACAGLQAAAYGVRAQQRAKEGGGWRKTWRANAVDGVATFATVGLGSAFRYAQYGKLGRIKAKKPALWQRKKLKAWERKYQTRGWNQLGWRASAMRTGGVNLPFGAAKCYSDRCWRRPMSRLPWYF
ncbi:RHS repeat-associated core domain-containing protein [Micromonospora sp. NPDC047707]|uniref:RHS repeat-associated core domain-containing protein n=1 Tax=Micromonospora sp. NPDC047707 TaxID=3154498 RepID=UPI0034553F86